MEQTLKRARFENSNKFNDVTEDELSKLRKTIIDEGINKNVYTSEESEIDDSSEDEMMVKFLPKQKPKQKMDVTMYAFQLNNKMSKLRSELARNEERLRYLQLDYNNKEIKIEDLQLEIVKYKEDAIIKKGDIFNSNEKNSLLVKDNKSKKIYLNFLFSLNIFYTILFIIFYNIDFF